MEGDGKYNKPSPLRNTKAANRPFQSPLRSVLSPHGKVDPHIKQRETLTLGSSQINSKTVSQRSKAAVQSSVLQKRICLDVEQEGLTNKEKRSIHEVDIKEIAIRIQDKKLRLEELRRQLVYKRKHDSTDLENLIKRWLRGCQEALVEFHKDICRNGETAVSMSQLLEQLGIPPELVQYSIEDCDFVYP